MRILKAGYGLDDKGYIVSDVSKDKINDIYLPCIQDSIDSLREIFHHQLHSIYIYGSVARGEAIVRKSDLDLIAMFTSNLQPEKLSELKELTKNLSDRYRTLVRDVGIAIAYYDYTIHPSNYFENAFIREISVCIYGEDLGKQFGPYKLTPEIAISFNGDIRQSMSRVLPKLETASDEQFKTISQNFARKLIRTYYSMVMVRSQIWTTRLHEQVQVIIQHFPDKEPILSTLLKWIDEPPKMRASVIEMFKKEGNWASENFIQEANISL